MKKLTKKLAKKLGGSARRPRSRSPVFRRLQRRLHVHNIPVNSIIGEGESGHITFKVRKVSDQRFKKMHVDRANFDITFGLAGEQDGEQQEQHGPAYLIHSYEALERALRLIQHHLMEEYQHAENAGLQFAIMSDALERGSINRPIQRLDDPAAVDDLLNHLEKVLQSNKQLAIDDSLKVSAIVNHVPPLKSDGEQRLRRPKKQMRLGANDDDDDPEDPAEDQSKGNNSGSSSGTDGSSNSDCSSSNSSSSTNDDDDSLSSNDSNSSSRRRRIKKKKKKTQRRRKKKKEAEGKTEVPKNRVALGPRFRDAGWKSEGNSLQVVPEFASGQLVNCCLLVALVMGLAFSKELDANKGRKKMSGVPLTEGWKKLRALGWEDGRKSRQAKKYLEDEVLLFCDRYQIPPEEFRLVDPEDVRERIRQLPVNVRIYDGSLSHEVVFSEPYQLNPDHPTVNILKITNPVNQLEHCGLIKRPDLYFSSIGRQRCLDCSKSFIKRYVFSKCGNEKRVLKFKKYMYI